MPRAIPSQPAKFALILAMKCLQCHDTKIPKYLSNRANMFLSYMEEFYLISIAIVVTQNIFLRCSKIDLKIADRLDHFPETIYFYNYI